MKKIMLAVGHEGFENALISRLNKQYSFTRVTTYREAILKEAIKNNPDILLIRENLPGVEKFSDIIYALRENVPSARIIFLSNDRTPGDEFLATIVSYGIYDILVGQSSNINDVVRLINTPNTFSDASIYAAKISVDEIGGKKMFETKIIHTPGATGSTEKAAKPTHAAIIAPKKKESAITIDEEIPVSFAPIVQRAEEPKAPTLPKGPELPKTIRDVKYDNSFYSPEEYLTRTSRPVKIDSRLSFKEDTESTLKPSIKQTEDILDDFVFDIVDEDGIPVSSAGNVESIDEPIVELVTPEEESASRNSYVSVDNHISEEASAEPLVVDVKDKRSNIIESVIDSNEADSDDSLDDLLSATQFKASDKPVFVDFGPVSAPEPIPTPKPQANATTSPTAELVKVQEPKVKQTQVIPAPVKEEPLASVPLATENFREIKNVESSDIEKPKKKNKRYSPGPIDSKVKTMLFVRTEEFGENHAAINVAVKYAKDNVRTLLVINKSNPVLEYFIDSLNPLKEFLVVKKLEGNYAMKDVLETIRSDEIERVIIDAFMHDNWQDWLVLCTSRFITLKQNKPWIQSVMRNDDKMLFLSRFFTLLLEEYTEFGVSPKVLMNEFRPLAVVRIKDRKENNFYALNAKMPMMLFKKNEEAIAAYKELFDYIAEREDESSD